VTDRYARVKTDSLQHVFFNGEGYAILENSWGFWDGVSPRDAETMLRTTRIERTFADQLASPAWEPVAPNVDGATPNEVSPAFDCNVYPGIAS
jgi:iron(II)-dependent oxidoreductase